MSKKISFFFWKGEKSIFEVNIEWNENINLWDEEEDHENWRDELVRNGREDWDNVSLRQKKHLL